MADLLHPTETESEDAPETPFDPGEFVLAVAADDQMEAQLLISACEEAGVPAILQSTRSGPGGAHASPGGGVNILLPRREPAPGPPPLPERQETLEAHP